MPLWPFSAEGKQAASLRSSARMRVFGGSRSGRRRPEPLARPEPDRLVRCGRPSGRWRRCAPTAPATRDPAADRRSRPRARLRARRPRSGCQRTMRATAPARPPAGRQLGRAGQRGALAGGSRGASSVGELRNVSSDSEGAQCACAAGRRCVGVSWRPRDHRRGGGPAPDGGQFCVGRFRRARTWLLEPAAAHRGGGPCRFHANTGRPRRPALAAWAWPARTDCGRSPDVRPGLGTSDSSRPSWPSGAGPKSNKLRRRLSRRRRGTCPNVVLAVAL